MVCVAQETAPAIRETGSLALAVPNSGSHFSFLATNLSSTLTRLLRAHEPVIST